MAEEQRIIVVQIDGLGRQALARALRRRHMPFIRSLLRRRGYALVPARTGLPASTPAFQAGLLYGARRWLPGFRWFEKSTGRIRVMKNYEDIAAACAGLPEEAGLFRGGAVYCSFFSGGAGRAYFTPGQPSPGPLAAPIRLSSVPGLVLRHLSTAARILGLSVYELWLELLDWLAAIRRGVPRRAEGLFPFERVAANAILREICTLAVLAEMRHGVPAVFVNYVGYDAMSHHRGPQSFSASLALAAIDRQIRRLWQAARRKGRASYEVFILSDHGQVSVTPFRWAVGRTLYEAAVEGELAGRVEEIHPGRHRELSHAAMALEHLREQEKSAFWPLRALAGLAIRRVERRLTRSAEASAVQRASELVVLPTSDLAHLYFQRLPGRPELAAIESAHPGLFGNLARTPGVRAVVGRQDGRTIIRGPEGELAVGREVTVAGADPLAGTGSTEQVARELAELAAEQASGDLIVLAGRLEPGKPRLWRRSLHAGFSEELGGHGGVERAEQETFLLAPAHRAPLFPEGCRPWDLYAGLSRVRWGAAGQPSSGSTPNP